MQPLGLTANQKDAYLRRLFGSHDFRILVDIMTLNETPFGSARLIDGQVNLRTGNNVRRTASLTVSDPEGAFDLRNAAEWSGRSVWADRLVRVRHQVWVPEINRTITTTPFIGPPSKIARSGAEVQVELQDKTSLAVRGSKPLTVPKGMNAVNAIRTILRDRTGEFRFRFPASKRRLSKPYSVGWADEASPWTVASRIASAELGWQLIYSCDGYATLRRRPSAPTLTLPHITDLPTNDVDFTQLVNYVRVLGATTSTTKGRVTTTTQPEGIARTRAGEPLSPETLGRKGVPRYLPMLMSEDGLKTRAQVQARADLELARSDQLEDAPVVSCVPFFHGDYDDMVRVPMPSGSVTLRIGDASIPLGVSGEMTIGRRRIVGGAPGRSSWSRVIRTRKVKPKKKKKPKGKR